MKRSSRSRDAGRKPDQFDGRSGVLRDVVVVGGGVSGLTAAWRLAEAGVDVCLLEGAPAVGGCTRSERREGFLLEKGPFNVIVRDPAFEALLEDLADEIKVVTAGRAARTRYIYRRGRLHALPSNPIALATTRLLSFGARCRLPAGLVSSPRAAAFEETIEQAAARRFGREVAETIVSAAISGILAGDISRLSLRACFPSVARIDAEARSLVGYGVRAAFRSKKNGKHRRRWRGLVSLDGGLGALTSTLGRRLGSDLLSGCPVQQIRKAKGEYEVSYRTDDTRLHSLRCRRVVIAAPMDSAGRILEPIAPGVSAIVSSMNSASLVVLNLGFRRRDVGHPLNGFGFLVPQNESDFPLMGVLWADSIFPHHAPPDHRLLRVFIGGARDPDAVGRTDDELVASAGKALRTLLHVNGDPMLVDVCRHPSAIPQYHVGHTEKVQQLRTAVAAHSGLHVIGNYLEGVSLNDCVRLATGVANRIVQSSRGPGSARINGSRRTTAAPAAAR